MAVAPAAAADDGGEPIRLEYSASAGCPDRAAFEARALARTARLRFVAGGETRTFDVAMEAGPSPTGHLAVRRGDLVEGRREIRASTCSDVAEALAFAAALAVEPPALGDESAVVPASTAAPSPSAAVPPSSSAPPPEPARASQADFLTAQALDSPPSAVVSPPHTLYLGADAAIATNVSPRVLLGASPYIGWRSVQGTWFEPGVRVAFLRAASGSFDTVGGTASLTWTVGRADGCLLSWPPRSGRSARLLACARVEAGALEGASTVPGAQPRPRAWFAMGPLMRAEWQILPPLFMELDVAAMVRATADRFYLLPEVTVYEVPFVGVDASAGLGIHFL